MFFILLFFFAVFFTLLCWLSFTTALGVFIILLPSYLIRFSFGPLPSTLLELSFGILFLTWLFRHARTDLSLIAYRLSHNRLLLISCFLFLISSFISIFFSVDHIGALGIWRAFFLEPMIVFIMLVGRGEKVSHRIVPWSLVLSSIPVSLLAIVQKLTGAFFPPSLDGTYLFGRVTSFFTAANAVGLYLEGVFFLNIYLLIRAYKEKKKYHLVALIFILLSSILAIIFIRSAGTWLGLAVGTVVLLMSLGYKKIAGLGVLGAVLASLFFPPLHSALLSKNKSTGNRFTLWHYTWNYVSQSPQNFVTGAGLRSYFERVQKPYYNDRKMEALTYPHNIFLNFWSEIGLIGMVSFVFITYYLLRISYFTFKHHNKLLGATLLATLAAILVHGLVDVPYFKNDLAMMFWIIAALVILSGAKDPLP